MTTIHITGLPGPDEHMRATALLAIRDALRVLLDEPAVTSEQALHAIAGRSLPILLGVTDSETAVEAARGLLEAQGFQIGVDLPPEEVSGLRTPQNEPDDSEPLDDAAARVALVMMQAADGSPTAAIGLAANLANAADEDNAEDGLFMEAGALLVETFRMDIQHETVSIMAQRAGMEDEA